MDRVSLISLAVGVVLPLLTAAVTKASWPEWYKQTLLALLSALTGAVIDIERGTGGASVIAANTLTTFATAVAVSAGTWRPTGAIAALESVLIADDADNVSEKQPPSIN